jgi:hypothetical protein
MPRILTRKYTRLLCIKNFIDTSFNKTFWIHPRLFNQSSLEIKTIVKQSVVRELSVCKDISHHLCTLFVRSISCHRNLIEKIIGKIFFLLWSNTQIVRTPKSYSSFQKKAASWYKMKTKFNIQYTIRKNIFILQIQH